MNGVIGCDTPRTRIIEVTDLNPHLMCVLCGGYYIDATTIIECLHSFCRTCIVKYLETSKFCPICDVQVHKTKPLLNIRSDQTLQDIVYKLVPGLFQREMKKRREFYSKQPPEVLKNSAPRSNEERGEVDSDFPHNIFLPNEFISVALEYSETGGVTNGTDQDEKSKNTRRRYLRCPVLITVAHIKKLIRAKYGLTVDHTIDIMFSRDCLSDEFMLMDIAYMCAWKRKGPLKLYYRICERPSKKLKTSHPSSTPLPVVKTDISPSDTAEIQEECRRATSAVSDEGEKQTATCKESSNERITEPVPVSKNQVPDRKGNASVNAATPGATPAEMVNGKGKAAPLVVNGDNKVNEKKEPTTEMNGRKPKVKGEDGKVYEERTCTVTVVRDNLVDVLAMCKSMEKKETNGIEHRESASDKKINSDVIKDDKTLSEKVNGITVNGKDGVSVRDIRST